MSSRGRRIFVVAAFALALGGGRCYRWAAEWLYLAGVGAADQQLAVVDEHRATAGEEALDERGAGRRRRAGRQCPRQSSLDPGARPVAGVVQYTGRAAHDAPVPGLFVNCGWGTGGFKATPGSGHVFAHTIAKGEPHPIAAPFTLDRFRTGRLIDEAAAAAVAH